MEEYITSVLNQVYLPQAVKDDAEAELRAEFAGAAGIGEDAAATASRLGDSYSVAERYNLSYRAAMRVRLSWLNAGIAALIALIVVFCWLSMAQFFRYGQERVAWYLYQTYVTQINNNDNALTQAAEAGGQASVKRYLENARSSEAYTFKNTIDASVLTLSGFGILASVMGISLLLARRREWMSYSLYIPILPILGAATDP
jgi:hypothetical protein